MATVATTETRTHHWPLAHYAVIAAIVLAATVGLLVGYTLANSATGSTTDWNVPVPFKDGYVPAQPM